MLQTRLKLTSGHNIAQMFGYLYRLLIFSEQCPKMSRNGIQIVSRNP